MTDDRRYQLLKRLETASESEWKHIMEELRKMDKEAQS